MTVQLIVALPAAETLAAFHRQRAAAEARAYHEDMARRLAEDAAAITRAIEAAGVTVDNQADAIRRRDLEIARRIIDRRPIMHGHAMPAEEVGEARQAMTRDIADAIEAARAGTAA
jgi:hypothetical protein